jgi:hypothetical protein
MFLEDYDGTLIDVPVKVLNTADRFSKAVNKGSNMEEWLLNRRFFLFDTLTGIEQEGGFST